MNILILSWRSPGHPNAGGAEAVTFEHAKAWVKAGHQVVWFSSIFKNGKIQETKDGVIIIRKGHYVVGVRFQAVLWYFLGKHPRFDLVVDEFHGIPFFTPLFVKGRKLAFIHEVAGEVWKYNPWPRPFNLIPAVFGTFFEPFIFKLLYGKIPFMTVSESTKGDLIKWGIPTKSVQVVHNGVRTFRAKKSIEKELTKTAMVLGALSKDKGISDIIKVFAEINRKDEEWQFWVVGGGLKEYVETLKKEAKDFGIENKVKFWGFVTDAKKFELLTRTHILINPSVHEGWGLVNIEANSVSTPVVGYNVHGLKDSVQNGKTGILVDFGEYRSLAQEALKLVNEKKKYESFAQNCKKWASKFTWEKATKESLELIESI